MIKVFDDFLKPSEHDFIYEFALNSHYKIGWNDTNNPEHKRYPNIYSSYSKEDVEKINILDPVNKILKNPYNYIAQPTLSLSTCPIYTKKGLTSRHVDLRCFALLAKEKVTVTSGGLTRVALKKDSLVVNSSQGGGTKDTWVLSS